MKARAVLLVFLSVLLASCSSIESHVAPKADLGRFKKFYVERRLTDNHHIDELLVAELRARGFEATSGPLTMMPEDAEAVVSYEDDWAWDFKSYLIRFYVNIRRARTDLPLANGSYAQPSPIPKSPAVVARRILDQLFKKG